ncbi:MAG TPA: flagellar biosynthesis repressor FlbT [Rhizobiales bacterium]|nr:flagellar biosynthesis repressor FlbT [Hyphomicrobiales bacterium]
MALKINLKPGEKFVVNGAVISNGDKRASLVVQNKVTLLREKDILQQKDANTPAKRIYFAVMMLYLDEAGRRDYYDEFVLRMSEYMSAIKNPEQITVCLAVSQLVMDQAYYKALMHTKKLLQYEAERLADGASGISENTEDG